MKLDCSIKDVAVTFMEDERPGEVVSNFKPIELIHFRVGIHKKQFVYVLLEYAELDTLTIRSSERPNLGDRYHFKNEYSVCYGRRNS